MYKFNDERLNDMLSNSESYKYSKNEELPKDPKDKLIRAFLIDAESLKFLKKKPNETVIFNKIQEIKLEVGSYLTSNGRLIKKDNFNKVYKNASPFVKNFLMERSKATESMVDIVERFHGKRNIPKNKNPKI